MAARFRAGEVESWESDLPKVVNFKTGQKSDKKYETKRMEYMFISATFGIFYCFILNFVKTLQLKIQERKERFHILKSMKNTLFDFPQKNESLL